MDCELVGSIHNDDKDNVYDGTDVNDDTMVITSTSRNIIMMLAAAMTSQLVSWCFKPSQPPRITSGLPGDDNDGDNDGDGGDGGDNGDDRVDEDVNAADESITSLHLRAFFLFFDISTTKEA